MRKSLFLSLAALLVFFSSISSSFSAEQLIFGGEDFSLKNSKIILDEGDVGADNPTLQFGRLLNESLSWDNANGFFQFTDDVNFGGNEILDFRLENLETAPTCNGTRVGRVYFNTATQKTYICDGFSWSEIGSQEVISSSLIAVQARRTSSYTMTTTFTDIDFDTTDFENTPATLEHDPENADRFLVKENGLYLIGYRFTPGASASSTHEAYGRVRINDTTVIDGSLSQHKNYQGEYSSASSSFFANLSANDFLSFQISRDAVADTTQGDVVFWAIKMEGIKGDPGEAGPQGIQGPAGTFVGGGTDSAIMTLDQDNSGSGADVDIVVNQGIDSNGVIRYNSTLNRWEFQNDGGEYIPFSVYGTEFNYFESTNLSISTSSIFQDKINATTTSLPVGTYKITISYNWNYSGETTVFMSRVLFGGSNLDSTNGTEAQRQEPQDTGTDQQYVVTKVYFVTVATPGTKAVQLQWASAGSTARIWNASIEIIRVQ